MQHEESLISEYQYILSLTLSLSHSLSPAISHFHVPTETSMFEGEKKCFWWFSFNSPAENNPGSNISEHIWISRFHGEIFFFHKISSWAPQNTY